MNDMVKRVASAIMRAEVPDAPPQWYEMMAPLYEPQARAAIEAMREPTPAMIRAAHNDGRRGSLWDIQKAMIDEALS